MINTNVTKYSNTFSRRMKPHTSKASLIEDMAGCSRRCNKCQEMKPVEQFGITCHRRKTGNIYWHYFSYCRPCFRQTQKEWSRNNPEKVAALRERYRDKSIAYHRSRNMVVRYGMTYEEKLALLESQGGVCPICGTQPSGAGMHVDHCHKSGIVRGILCGRCNQGLGYFRDDPSLMRKAANYLAAANSAIGMSIA